MVKSSNTTLIDASRLDIKQMQSRIRELELLADEKKHSDKVQNALLKIASIMNHVKDMSDFYHDLHEILSDLMYANNFYIALLSEDRAFVKFVYFIDEEEPENPVNYAPEPIVNFKKSITGYLLRTGDALLADHRHLKDLERKGEIKLRGKLARDWLGIPLEANSEIIGVLVVQSYDDNIRYSNEDKDVLTFVSQHIASALNQKQYEQRLKEYSEKLELKVNQRTDLLNESNLELKNEIAERKKNEILQKALFKISELANSKRDLNDFYASVYAITNTIMPSFNFYIAIFDHESKLISFPYLVDEYDKEKSSRELDITKPLDQSSPTEQVLRAGKYILINQNNREDWLNRGVINGTLPTTWLGAPLISDDKTFGVITIQSYDKDQSYTKRDAEVLSFIAQQVATTFVRKKSTDNLQLAHEALTENNNDLERRVEERTQELSLMNAKLKDTLKERALMQEKLSHEAFHDTLTNLPNRALFTDRLQHLIKQIKRKPLTRFSVLFLDLDRFKVVNDSLGHLMGDRLLREVAERLEDIIRPEDTVARLGGDEFCILVNSINQERDVAVIASRILEVLSQPYQLGEHTVFSSTSIGITLSHADYQSPEEVLRDADSAMYHAKETGKSRYAFFDKEMHEQALKRLKLESELRQAIINKEIDAYFQPVIDLRTDRIVGFEALARWNHKELGFVGPAEFIPIAEETGLIYDLGKLILRKALRALHVWQDNVNCAKDLSMSVNFSSRQIEHHDLLKDIEDELKANSLRPSSLRVEITESLLIENADLASGLLESLASHNIQVMLDDFGTGYSSLSYLHKYDLNTIKIDRSFINRMVENKKHYAIVETVAFMARSLELDTIAEGVETQEHVDLLKNLNIHYAQGFFYSKAVPCEEAQALIIQYNQS